MKVVDFIIDVFFRTLVIVILLISLLWLVSPVTGAEPGDLIRYKYYRPNITTGFGPVVDDLERMADSASHGMTNRSDPGNWVHELTHYVNARMRSHASRHYGRPANGFYVLGGLSIWLPEPAIKLADVSRIIPPRQQGNSYQTYLIDQQRWWNNEPLYILDEATAAANALCYQVTEGRIDRQRERLAIQFRGYSNALLRAVLMRDSRYSHFEQLRAFVVWHNLRLEHLIQQHQAL